jgi:hypothetical protein
MVERPAHVVVRALDRDGQPIEIDATGPLARCLQHEIDHLDGKLFIDYLSVLKRRSVARAWEKEIVHYPNFIRKLDPNAAARRRPRAERPTDVSGATATHDSNR